MEEKLVQTMLKDHLVNLIEKGNAKPEKPRSNYGPKGKKNSRKNRKGK